MDELDFIIDCIENRYVSGRRGIGDEEWQQGVEAVGNRADVFFDDYDGYYVYIWKYLGLLQRDSHFALPDGGRMRNTVNFTHDAQTMESGIVNRNSNFNQKKHPLTLPTNQHQACLRNQDYTH